MTRTSRLPHVLSKAEKPKAGRTGPSQTPLELRVTGRMKSAESLDAFVRGRASRRLARLALYIERVTVRFSDVNGPRGGDDIRCQIRIIVSGAPVIVAEQEAGTVEQAFVRTLDTASRTLRRTADRRGWSAGRQRDEPAATKTRKLARTEATPEMHPEGSIIGARVGQGRDRVKRIVSRPGKQRRDVPIDTAAPGMSATDRKAGGASTAARNIRLNDERATSALEDSARVRPSRKSTRRSANRAKRDAPQRITAVESSRAPVGQATRAQARRKKPAKR